MTVRTPPVDTGMGVSFIVSTVIHLTVFLLLAWYGSHRPPLKIEETYYVDVVNLPVVSPRTGSPAQTGNDAQQAPAPPKATTPPMALPTPAKPGTKPSTAKQTATPNKKTDSTPASSSEFADRMARLERAAEARQEEAAMARLRDKVKAQGSGSRRYAGRSRYRDRQRLYGLYSIALA